MLPKEVDLKQIHELSPIYCCGEKIEIQLLTRWRKALHGSCRLSEQFSGYFFYFCSHLFLLLSYI